MLSKMSPDNTSYSPPLQLPLYPSQTSPSNFMLTSFFFFTSPLKKKKYPTEPN